MKKFGMPILLALVFPFAWALASTDIFIRQAELRIDGEKVYFKRSTPFGTVSARWRSEIYVLDGSGRECHSGEWKVARYEARKSNAVTYSIGSWAAPCIELGQSYTVTTTRQVLLWEVFPLRPSTHVDLIKG